MFWTKSEPILRKPPTLILARRRRGGGGGGGKLVGYKLAEGARFELSLNKIRLRILNNPAQRFRLLPLRFGE